MYCGLLMLLSRHVAVEDRKTDVEGRANVVFEGGKEAAEV